MRRQTYGAIPGRGPPDGIQPGLVERVNKLARTDPAAEFVLLVPATSVRHLSGWAQGEATSVARRRAEDAKVRLEETGARIVRSSVVNALPLLAIDDELRKHPAEYAAIIICTLPIGVSRWLRLDLPHRVERRYSLPVIHIVAAATAAPDAPSSAGFDSILVPLNGIASEAVLEPVRYLAKRLGSRISLVHASEVAEDDAEAESYLDRTASALRQEELVVDTAVLGGNAGRVIVGLARGANYGMVAMATCGRAGGAGAELGDVTANVLDGCPCPLLLTRPRSGDPAATPCDISRLVVPLDGSPAAEQALPYVEHLARRMAIPITIIRAISVSGQTVAAVPEPAGTGVKHGLAWRQSIPDHPLQVESRLDISTTSYLSDVCQRLAENGMEASWHAPWGAAPDALFEYVGQDDGSLIVMSGHGGGLSRATVGSVAHAVIRGAPAPVLAVPPAGGPA